MSYCKLGKASIEIISNILKKNVIKLQTLNISGNGIGDSLFAELALGISNNLSLNQLLISDNLLSKTSSIILSTLLRYDKKIKFLDISKNLIDDLVINNIFKGLISNTTLEILMLNENALSNKALGVIYHIKIIIIQIIILGFRNNFANQRFVKRALFREE